MKEVRKIKKFETQEWIMKLHYAKRMPSISYAFGLYDNKELTGVVTYGSPASPSLCIGVCGPECKDMVIELNRLCLLHNKKNEASYLVANSLKLLPKPMIVVSYADTSMNPTGYVYQACNFIYTGKTVARTDVDTGDKHSRHYQGLDMSKRKQRYEKHRYIYFLGSKKDRRDLRKKLRYEEQSYPKTASEKYIADHKPQVQGILF